MKIKEFEDGMAGVDLEWAKVIDIGETRTFNKNGRSGRVATAIIEDETGTMYLSLWDNQTEMLSINDEISITKGHIKIYHDFKNDKEMMQISTGKTGKLTILEKDEEVIE